MHQELTALATFAPIGHRPRPDCKPGGCNLLSSPALVAVRHQIGCGVVDLSLQTIVSENPDELMEALELFGRNCCRLLEPALQQAPRANFFASRVGG